MLLFWYFEPGKYYLKILSRNNTLAVNKGWTKWFPYVLFGSNKINEIDLLWRDDEYEQANLKINKWGNFDDDDDEAEGWKDSQVDEMNQDEMSNDDSKIRPL